MPANNARSKWRTLGSAYLKRRRASTPRSRIRKKARLPSKRVRTSPAVAPNVYHFTRGFDSFASVGTVAGIFSMNTDARFQIIDLRTKFSDLPEFTEFNALFSEYKIKNFTITLVPTHATNKVAVLNSTDAVWADAIPNYEVFAVPSNFTDDQQDFTTMTGVQIDSWLNQTQRKRMMIMPSRPRIYRTDKPRVPKYEGPPNHTGGTASVTMSRPYWMSTGTPAVGAADERDIYHYGMKILIRRVDGNAVVSVGNKPLGFRVHHQINFMCRKVQ